MVVKNKIETDRIQHDLPLDLKEDIWLRASNVATQVNEQLKVCQVFELISVHQTALLDNQLVIHRVEVLGKQCCYAISVERPLDAKIYVLGNETLKMMFEDEYQVDA